MRDKDKPFIALGIADSHDAGVALLADGQVLAALNEERLTRKKMQAGTPRRALTAVFDIAGIDPAEVDVVALAGLSASAAEVPMNNDFLDDDGHALPQKTLAEWLDHASPGRYAMQAFAPHRAYQGLLRRRAERRAASLRPLLSELGIDAPISSYEHHDCHAATAYYAAGEQRALIITNDGFGDSLCSKVQLFDTPGAVPQTLKANSFYNSIGNYYNFVTLLCGFRKAHHAGKTTGLAAYGDAQRTLDVFRSKVQWDADAGSYINHGGIFANCLNKLREELADTSREDKAAGIQQHLEDVLCEMVQHYVASTGVPQVALAGGVHANVKANQRIASVPGLERLFVYPHMGDGGLPVGAACLATRDRGPRPATTSTLQNVYFGPQFSPDAIRAALAPHQLPVSTPDNLAAAVAEALAANRIVARFDGRMEFGPRALGNRSILYPADRAEVNDWLNKRLRRTEFMPFAPVMRVEDAPLLLEGFDQRTADTAQFMTVTYDVSARCKAEAPAVVHVDGTARPQVLRRATNPGYYDILTEYERRTGLKTLVNTSFNMHEEPIVCTPSEAVTAFLASGLDALAIGPFLVTNPAASEHVPGS